MHLAYAFLLAGALPASSPIANLDFASGRLTHWSGQGFYVTTATGNGPSLHCGVCSSDRGAKGRTALLHRTFLVPPGAGAIVFTAAIVRPAGLPDGPPLDITLEAAESRYGWRKGWPVTAKRRSTAPGRVSASQIHRGLKRWPPPCAANVR
jgi:hypothetical protein